MNPKTCEDGLKPDEKSIDCIDCEIGAYCVNGISTNCPPGTYCQHEAMKEPIVCPAGFFCEGKDHKKKCIEKYYSEMNSTECSRYVFDST